MANNIVIEDGAVIEPLSLIYNPSSFSLGERARIAGFVRIIGKKGEATFGAQSFVGLGCLIDTTGGVVLRPRAQVGPRSTIYTHGETTLTFNQRFPSQVAPVELGADSWLGMGTIVHPGVTVGERVIVMPGLTLRKSIPSGNTVLPSRQEHSLVPSSHFEISEGEMEQRIQDLFLKLATGAVSQQASHLYFHTEKGERVALSFCSQSELGLAELVWVVRLGEQSPAVPVFEFATLTIHGPKTRLAERFAAELLLHGAQFVYAN